MTTIDKLGIQGIRSFSPENLEVISFEKPLTLIVGHNGAGKTTLVECLKMLCTGELPPNSDKGKSFIFEPNIFNQPHVKAQIRLIFKSFNNKKVCGIRSFQLSNTKDKNGHIKSSYKALESVLQIKGENGETRSISNKCADMDSQVPQLMGVSKATLENVLFCHQEDNCWPLGDVQKLKKKFDDLFGASRYTKALKAIDDARKEQREIHKEKQNQLRCLETHLHHAKKYQNELDCCESLQKQNSQKISNYSIDLQKIEEEIKTSNVEYLKNEESLNSLHFKKEMKKNLIEELNHLQESLNEIYEEPLVELLSYKEKFISQAQDLDTRLKALENEKYLIEQNITTNNQDIQNHFENSIDLYKVQEKKESAEKNLAKILDKLKQQFSIVNDDKLHLQRFIEESIKNKIADKKRVLKDKDTENCETIKILSKTYNEKNSSLTTFKLELGNNFCLQERLNNEIKKIETEIYNINEISLNMEEIEEKIKNLRRVQNNDELKEKQKRYENDLDGMDREIKNVEDELRILEAQKNKYDKDFSIRTEMDIYKNQLVKKESILKQKFFFLSEFFNTNFRAINFNEDFIFSSKYVDICKECENLKDKKNVELQKIRFALAKLEEKFSNENINFDKVKTLKTKLHVLLNSVNLENVTQLSEKIESLNQKEKETLRDLLTAKNSEQIYHTFLNYSDRKNKCAFCTRYFASLQELKEMKISINTKIAQLPERINELEKEHAAFLKEKEKFYDLKKRFDELKYTEDLFITSQNSLTIMQTEIIRLKNEEEKLQKEVEDYDTKMKKVKKIENEIENYTLLYNEIASLKQSHEKLIEQLQEIIVDNPTIEDINFQFSSLQNKKKILEKRREDFFSELMAIQNHISNSHIELLSLENKHKSFVINEERKKAFLSDKKLKEIELERLTDEVPFKELSIKKLETEVEGIKNEIDLHNKNYNSTVLDLQNEIRLLNEVLNEFICVWEEIKYAEENEENSNNAKKMLDKLNEERQNLLDLVKSKSEQINEIKESIEKNKYIQQMLTMNIDSSRLEEKISVVDNEIANIEKQIGTSDILKKKKELEILKEKQNEISCEIARYKGIYESKEEEKKKIKKELSSSIYMNIDERVSALHVATQSHALAIGDLAKYHKALDKALMKYHTTKMQEINKRLRELWQSIYTGNDIDYVAVRSDTDENTEISQTAHFLRSYNYRVVMVKGGNEIDMRGRCSSGQKVLCSILIRLTLTEIFCQNCKILTLDEPTTNLDQYNVQKLASALCQLIEIQNVEKSNMQLIIITHDEEFVSKLSARGICNYYYRVSKDNNGFSVIHKSDITHFQ